MGRRIRPSPRCGAPSVRFLDRDRCWSRAPAAQTPWPWPRRSPSRRRAPGAAGRAGHGRPRPAGRVGASRPRRVAALGYELGLDPVEMVPVTVGADGGPGGSRAGGALRARWAAAAEALGRPGAARAHARRPGRDGAAGARARLRARGRSPGCAPGQGRYLRPLLGLRRGDDGGGLRRARAAGVGRPAQRRPGAAAGAAAPRGPAAARGRAAGWGRRGPGPHCRPAAGRPRRTRCGSGTARTERPRLVRTACRDARWPSCRVRCGPGCSWPGRQLRRRPR